MATPQLYPTGWTGTNPGLGNAFSLTFAADNAAT